MQLLKYKLGELLDVSRGASLSGEFYSSEGELIRLTLGHFDYQNGGFKENTSKDNLYFVGPVKSQFILNEGDIITPLTEQTPGLLGSTAMIPESEEQRRIGATLHAIDKKIALNREINRNLPLSA